MTIPWLVHNHMSIGCWAYSIPSPFLPPPFNLLFWFCLCLIFLRKGERKRRRKKSHFQYVGDQNLQGRPPSRPPRFIWIYPDVLQSQSVLPRGINLSLFFTCLESLFSSSMYFCSLGINVRKLAFTYTSTYVSVMGSYIKTVYKFCMQFNLQYNF